MSLDDSENIQITLDETTGGDMSLLNTIPPESADPIREEEEYIQIIVPDESPPNPTVELMKQHSKIALLIGLNYGTLQNRITNVNNAKQILINSYSYTEDNIIVLSEPTREELTAMLNSLIGSSSLVNEIIIYYSGYGNGINADLTKEEGVVDNLAKVVVAADLTTIDISQLIPQSCSKTLCIMDMCPYQDDGMLLKWGVDITGNIKVVTFCESDCINSNKNSLLQQLREPWVPL